MKSILIFIFQLLQTCSFAQFSLYRNKDFTGLYFNEAENISTNCVNLPESERHYAPPGSIKTSQCVVFFNAVDCIALDSFLVDEDVPDIIPGLKLRRSVLPRAVSYRACLPSDKYLYPYPVSVVYTSLNSYPSYISGYGNQVQKIPVEPGCTRTFVNFNNVMALSPICVKLYTTSFCSDFDFGAISTTSITLQPWQPKSISYFGHVNSVKACDEEDLYKRHKKPKSYDISRKNDYSYTYTGGSSYGTGGSSSFPGGILIIKLIFGLIGFLCVSGGTFAAVKKKNSRPAPPPSDVATEAEVAQALVLNTVTVESSPPPPYEKVVTDPPEYKKAIVQDF